MPPLQRPERPAQLTLPARRATVAARPDVVVVGGALLELMERLLRRGGAIAPSEETGYTVPLDPEAYKSAALELLDATGVRYLLHAFASGVTGEPRRPA